MRRSKKTAATDRAALQGALSDLVGSLDTLRPADIGRKAKEIANILPSGLSYDDLHDVLREELAALTGQPAPRKHRTEYDDALAVDFEDIRSVDGDRSAAELLAALAEPDEDIDEPAAPAAAVEESEAPVGMWLDAAGNVTFDDTPRSTIIDQPQPAGPSTDDASDVTADDVEEPDPAEAVDETPLSTAGRWFDTDITFDD